MTDAYLVGKVNRISPEAPVPIVSVTERERRLGGAANVAVNLNALGAKTLMASVISDDDQANEFEALLTEQGMSTKGILRSPDRKTTVKTRIISNYQQLLRVDEEETGDLTLSQEEAFLGKLKALFEEEEIDVVVLQDYNKGVITQRVIEFCVQEAEKRKIPITADPKKKNFEAFHHITLFKPNLKELREGLNMEVEPETASLDLAVAQLKKRMGIGAALITLSEKGVYISDGETSSLFKAHLRNIADVSGAGDTVIAVASLCLTTSLSLESMAKISNLAGGLVCEQVGVVPIDRHLLMEEAISFEK